MINDEKYFIQLRRLDICDIILALGLLSCDHPGNPKWKEIHDDVQKQMDNMDSWYIANHKEDFE